MTTSAVTEVELLGDEATRALGRKLGASTPSRGGVICLSGHLGAGKTSLVKGLAEGLGVARARDVTSPTFVRMVRIEGVGGSLPLVHVDAYRMNGPADVFELGLEVDLAGGALVALEWPERVAAAIPSDHVLVELDHVDETRRRARVRGCGPRSCAWLARAGVDSPVGEP